MAAPRAGGHQFRPIAYALVGRGDVKSMSISRPSQTATHRGLMIEGSRLEVWVAITTQVADERFVEERPRDVLFGLVLAAAKAELWEPRVVRICPTWYSTRTTC
jgi:hypothetical protein